MSSKRSWGSRKRWSAKLATTRPYPHWRRAPQSINLSPPNMSRFPAWHFRSMDLGEVQVDPVHDEFFKAQDLADALVREAIQNSLDARLPRSRSPVRVRFRFASGAHALPAEGVREYFDGLETHLQASAKAIHTI